MTYYRITHTICCKHCKQISISFVVPVIDKRVNSESLPLIDTSDQLKDHTCHNCGCKGQWWILNKFKDADDQIEMKTVFTFELQNNSCSVSNPIGELSLPFSGKDMMRLVKKKLNDVRSVLETIQSKDGGIGIVMWSLDKKYELHLSLFDFENMGYAEVKSLMDSLDELFENV